MKNIIIVLMFTIFINFGNAKQINGIKISKSEANLNLKLNLPQFQINDIFVNGNYYKTININGYGSSTCVGRPNLPQITFNLAINTNQKPSAKVIDKTSYEQVLDKHIVPYQAPCPTNLTFSEIPFNYDTEYYNTVDNGEKEIINISEPYSIGGVRGVSVTIYPFSYNPAVKKLTVNDNLIILLEMGGYSETANNHSKYYNEFLNSVFINYEEGNTNLNNNATSNSNYLIITAPEFQTYLQSFINYKTSRGFSVESFTTYQTGTTKELIKNFILQRYNNLSTRPEFILFVGDVDRIPAWTGAGLLNPTTDLNYTLLEGNDYYADAFIGRFSVSNPTELQNIINKT